MVSEKDTTWIERFGPGPLRGDGAGSLVGVKDLIDVAGSVTTAGCRAVAERATPASRDAACISALRTAGVRLCGKTNLHELAYGISGVNPWYGTPENPADPGRVPGGSSSGSAAAVARGEVDWALGSDTGGSVRIPAASCGVVGLKTTHGRLSLDGVWPLAPSFDTIGPIAPDVAGVVTAMSELEGGFEPATDLSFHLGRLRVELGARLGIDPAIEAAVDDALLKTGIVFEGALLAGWKQAWVAQQTLLSDEAFAADAFLLEPDRVAGLGEPVRGRLASSKQDAASLDAARRVQRSFSQSLEELFSRFGALVLPTLPRRPFFEGESSSGYGALCSPVNLAGLPAITLPVPCPGRPPTGLQLVAPAGGEERLVALAVLVEQAVSS